MEIKNLEVVAFGSTVPDGINADVVLSDGVTLAVYRDWDNPHWYLYDVEFGPSEHGTYVAGIDDIDRLYKIPEGAIEDALESAIGAIRDTFTPA